MNLTVYSPDVPKMFRNKISKGKAIKQFAFQAIQRGLAPIPLPSAGLLRVSMNITAEEQDLFDQAVETAKKLNFDYPSGKVIGAYCYAQIQEVIRKESQKKPKSSLLRPDQEKYYLSISKKMATGGIVLAEGGTGLGKSRVLAMLARDAIKNKQGPVCVTAPTIAILKHLYDELQQVPDTQDLKVSILLGKSQFLNPDSLQQILNDDENQEKISNYKVLINWFKDGCPPLSETGSASLESICPGISYLYDDLLYLAPELKDEHNLSLMNNNGFQDDNPNKAFEVYQEMFVYSKEADITLCSHAMLAVYLRFLNFKQDNISLLPDFKTLLVDEAHAFETTVSQMNTDNLSIFSLRSALRKTNLGAARVRKAALKNCDALIGNRTLDNVFLSRSDLNEKKYNTETGHVLSELEALEQSLRKLFGKKISSFIPKSTTGQIIHDSLYALFKINKSNMSVTIKTSPIKGYPSFTVGPATVKHLFEALWDKVISAALVSATLTLPGIDGRPNASHIKRILNIPGPRLQQIEPVRQKWLYTPVVLHTPPQNMLKKFMPSSISATELIGKEVGSTNQEDFYSWFSTIYKEIEKIITNTKGGTLVLLTSYALVDEFQNAAKKSEFFDRMLFSSKKLAFQRQRQLFIDASLKKDRPVWFALGSAWTGLDLSGQQYNIPAKDDHLLSDLIIPKVPFGLNTSMTGLSRNTRWTNAKGITVSFPTSSRNDAAFLFKQGVGRLIRREGVPQKHLWVLDSRIWLKNKKVYGVFQDILKPYSKGV